VKRGCWDAIHVVQVRTTSSHGRATALLALPHTSPLSPAGAQVVTAADGKTATYKLTSTVLLTMVVERPDTLGLADLSGSLTRRATATHAISADKGHIAVCGGMIEAMEGDMRTALDALYISKTKEIVGALHSRSGAAAAASKGFVADLAAAVKKHGSGGSA